MNYQKLADDIEKDLLKQIKKAYIEAYRKATKEIQKYQKLIDNMAELEKGLPEDWTKEQIEHWRMGFYTQQSRFYEIRKDIERFFVESGEKVSELIQDTLPDYYNLARQYTIDNIHLHSNISFSMLNKNEIKTIISDQQPVFSKIAFKNLGKNKKMRDMLSSELLQSTILGEGKEALKRRIKRVAGYQYNYQALRTAQTERTRVQSQASYATAKEAQAMGLKIVKKWSAAMVRTRDTHAELNGKIIPIDEDFELSDGDRLSYPGDPKGRACNIINCRCDITYEVGKVEKTKEIEPQKRKSQEPLKENMGEQKKEEKQESQEDNNVQFKSSSKFDDLNGFGVNKEDKQAYLNILEDRYDNSSDLAKKIYDKYIPDGGACEKLDEKGTDGFSPITNKIFLNIKDDLKNDRGKGTTWYHEHGHYLDYNAKQGKRLSSNKKFIKALKNDIKNEINKRRSQIISELQIANPQVNIDNDFLKKHKTINNAIENNSIVKLSKELADVGINKTHSIQDIFGSYKKGKYYDIYIYRHTNEYWRTTGVEEEAFAHFFEAMYNKEKEELIMNYLPNAQKEFKEIMKGLL